MNHTIPTSLSVQSAPATGPEVCIRVNAMNPGLVITEGVTTAGFDQSDFRKTLESQTGWSDGRYRAGGGLLRLIRFEMEHRRNTTHRGRSSLGIYRK